MKYPESVPVLTGRQFTCGVLFENEKRKCCCLLGWAVEAFTNRGPETARCEAIMGNLDAQKYVEESYDKIPIKVKKALAEAAYNIPKVREKFLFANKKEFIEEMHKDIPSINDDTEIDKKYLAQIWNDAMKLLGYTEVVEIS